MKSHIVLALGLTALPFVVHANEKGNGGGAFVCRSSSGRILSAELVDIYEAKNQLGLKIRNFGGMKMEEQLEIIQLKAHQANPTFGAALDASLKTVKQKLRTVGNVILENTNDFQISISPRTCTGGRIKFEQLASYTPTGDLIVDKELYDRLPTTHKAALYIHEAVYLIAREKYGAESSLEARWATGYLLSTTASIPARVLSLAPSAGIPNRKYACRTTLLPSACFTVRGCYLGTSAVELFGKTMAEVVSQYQAMLGANPGWTPCNRFTSVYASKNYDLQYQRYQCGEVSTMENACFQRF